MEIILEQRLITVEEYHILEYWIINVEKREIEVYRSPFKGQYRSRDIFFPEDEIPISEFNVSVPVKALLV